MNFGLADDVWAGGTLNRIGDAANVTVNGSTTAGLTYTGPANGSALTNVETIGTLTFSGGRNNVTLVPGTGNEVQITTGTHRPHEQRHRRPPRRESQWHRRGLDAARRHHPDGSPHRRRRRRRRDEQEHRPLPPRRHLGHRRRHGFRDARWGERRRVFSRPREYSATIAGDDSLRNVSTAGGETVTSNMRINSLRVTGGTTTINAGAT